MLDPWQQKLLKQARAKLEAEPRDAQKNAGHTTAHVRISPSIAADYRARHVFPYLWPPNEEPRGSYPVDHMVSRAVAQAVFDDAIEQAARYRGSLKHRGLTLAYNTLAKRTSRNFGGEWSPYNPGALCPDPADFPEQASIVDALLHAISRPPKG